MNAPHPSLESQAVRQRIRRGEITGHTSGLAPGCVQGNVVILPQALAADFLRFCQLNPKPCPVIGMSQPGDPALPALERTPERTPERKRVSQVMLSKRTLLYGEKYSAGAPAYPSCRP